MDNAVSNTAAAQLNRFIEFAIIMMEEMRILRD
jgi:hypothetical protein